MLGEKPAQEVLRQLEYRDVARGGVWNASVGDLPGRGAGRTADPGPFTRP